MNRFSRIAAPLLMTAGVLGAAVGMAGTASASITVTRNNVDSGMFASPDVDPIQDMMGARWAQIYGSVPPPNFNDQVHG